MVESNCSLSRGALESLWCGIGSLLVGQSLGEGEKVDGDLKLGCGALDPPPLSNDSIHHHHPPTKGNIMSGPSYSATHDCLLHIFQIIFSIISSNASLSTTLSFFESMQRMVSL